MHTGREATRVVEVALTDAAAAETPSTSIGVGVDATCVEGLGFSFWGLGFRVWDLEFGVDATCVEGWCFGVWYLILRLVFVVWGLVFGVWSPFPSEKGTFEKGPKDFHLKMAQVKAILRPRLS